MIDTKLISVVIPAYNVENYIDQCLENLKNQSFSDLEIIVVDDGSTDNTVKRLEAYPEVKLIQQENKGVSVARNEGLKHAKGKFVHFLDADDLINAKFYELLFSAITEKEADIACAGMINQRVKNQTNLFKHLRVYTDVADKLTATYVGRVGYVWRYLFRTSFLRDNALQFEPGRIVEDLIFSLSAVYFAKSVVVVPGAEYTYVNRPHSQLTLVDEEQQAKRDRDWQHAKAQRKAFADKYGFKIPGIDYDKFGYFLWKVRNSLRQ